MDRSLEEAAWALVEQAERLEREANTLRSLAVSFKEEAHFHPVVKRDRRFKD